MRRRSAVLVAAVVAAATGTACTVSGLAFVQDDSVAFRGPENGDVVALPVTIEWETDRPLADGEAWAIFVDRHPVRPSQGVEVVADDSCRAIPGCVDAAYLADRGVYVTDGTSLTLETVPVRGREGTDADRHDVTIVRLDPRGERAGEAAWRLTFDVDRSA